MTRGTETGPKRSAGPARNVSGEWLVRMSEGAGPQQGAGCQTAEGQIVGAVAGRATGLDISDHGTAVAAGSRPT